MPLVRVLETNLPDVKVIQPEVFSDARGFFLESWNRAQLADAGIDVEFVQDNHSRSARGVLRGLHYQLPNPQGKLIRVISGAIWDVAVDLRRSSKTFSEWVGIELDDVTHKQLWVPPGFGHGFIVLSDSADVSYKTTAYYESSADRVVRYDDPTLAVSWPGSDFVLSDKDANAPGLDEVPVFD